MHNYIESKCTCQEVKVGVCLIRKGQSKGNPGNETILYPDEIVGYTTRHMEKCLLTQVHCSIIHSNQNTEATMSIKRLMDKENVVYTCNVHYLALKMKKILLFVTVWMN